MELEGAEHQALDEGPQTGVVAQGAQRGGDRQPAADVAGQGGARAAQVVGAAGPDADEQHQAEVGVGQPGGVQHHPLDDLADGAGRGRGVEKREQVLAELVDQLGGTRAQGRPVVGVGEHRDRDRVHPDDGGRSDVAQCDLRR